MAKPTNDELQSWLSPATAGITAEQLKAYKAIVESTATTATFETILDLVGLAHNLPEAFKSETAKRLLPPTSDGMTVDQGHALVARLATCILVQSLGSASKNHLSAALLIQSAEFLQHKPVIPELVTRAEEALLAKAVQCRTAPDDWTPILGSVRAELSVEESAATTDETDTTAKAIELLAEKLDELASRIDQRLSLLEEEHNALWWSYTGRSTTEQKAWAQVKPLALRVVLASMELGEQVLNVPGPPSVVGLLAIALGKDSTKTCTISEITLAAVDAGFEFKNVTDHHLLPFAAAVKQIQTMTSKDDAWKTVLKRTRSVDPEAKVTALDAACQLFREVELGTKP